MFSLTDVCERFDIYLIAGALRHPNNHIVARSFFIRARSRAEALGLFQLESTKEGYEVISWQVKDTSPTDIEWLLDKNRTDTAPAIVSGAFEYGNLLKKPFFPLDK